MYWIFCSLGGGLLSNISDLHFITVNPVKKGGSAGSAPPEQLKQDEECMVDDKLGAGI